MEYESFIKLKLNFFSKINRFFIKIRDYKEKRYETITNRTQKNTQRAK